jgi:hypothetical protein
VEEKLTAIRPPSSLPSISHLYSIRKHPHIGSPTAILTKIRPLCSYPTITPFPRPFAFFRALSWSHQHQLVVLARSFLHLGRVLRKRSSQMVTSQETRAVRKYDQDLLTISVIELPCFSHPVDSPLTLGGFFPRQLDDFCREQLQIRVLAAVTPRTRANGRRNIPATNTERRDGWQFEQNDGHRIIRSVLPMASCEALFWPHRCIAFASQRLGVFFRPPGSADLESIGLLRIAQSWHRSLPARLFQK